MNACVPMPDRRGTSADVEVDQERLEALLGGPAMAWLRDRVRRRLEQGREPTGTVSLADPSDNERAGLDRLLGRRPSVGARVTVSLDVVDAMLREAGICTGWRQAIEVLDGPVVDRAAHRRANDEAWARVGATLPATEPWHQRWRDDLIGTGVLRRLADGPDHAVSLLERTRRVLDVLPAAGVPLARLAAQTLDDSHALDGDRPEATLVLKALQHQHLPPDERGPLPTGVDRRALWAAAGVLLDELSAPVLVHNLPVTGDGLVDQTLQAHGAAGEPTRLTLRALLRHPPDLTELDGRTVHVCENPTVVAAAADALGPHGPPLICTDGQPSAAVQTLLRRLAAAEARLVHHGDFDAGGLRIATVVIERFGAQGWRMDARSYLAAPAGPPLTARVTPVAWSPGLAEAMNERSVAVHEEQVLDEVLDDLRHNSS